MSFVSQFHKKDMEDAIYERNLLHGRNLRSERFELAFGNERCVIQNHIKNFRKYPPFVKVAGGTISLIKRVTRQTLAFS
jgi:hypothetical protein